MLLTFGARLKQLRLESNLTQAELADKLSLGESTISFYESSKREPDYETLQRFADFFLVSVDYILGRTNVRKQPEILAAHRSDGYDTPLPQEAIDEVERFKEFMRHKYRHWKPGMTQGEYLKKYGHDGEGGEEET